MRKNFAILLVFTVLISCQSKNSEKGNSNHLMNTEIKPKSDLIEKDTTFYADKSSKKLDKDSLLQKDVKKLVEEMEFMYGYDQILREYTIYKTLNKGKTDSIEELSPEARGKYLSQVKFYSDTLKSHIWKNYLNPKDKQHTERMIQIIKKYGFPTIKRIRKYYNKKFDDPEFRPLILLIHSPEEFHKELKSLVKNELKEGRLSQCQYAYLLWHLNGRQDVQILLDNGYEFVEENGQRILKSNCD